MNKIADIVEESEQSSFPRRRIGRVFPLVLFMTADESFFPSVMSPSVAEKERRKPASVRDSGETVIITVPAVKRESRELSSRPIQFPRRNINIMIPERTTDAGNPVRNIIKTISTEQSIKRTVRGILKKRRRSKKPPTSIER